MLTLRPFLSGTLFRAYWSIFEYRMAGLTYLSGGYVHFLDVLTSLLFGKRSQCHYEWLVIFIFAFFQPFHVYQLLEKWAVLWCASFETF